MTIGLNLGLLREAGSVASLAVISCVLVVVIPIRSLHISYRCAVRTSCATQHRRRPVLASADLLEQQHIGILCRDNKGF